MFPELAMWSFIGAIVLFVLCFACWAIGFWQGERQAARNYRTMSSVMAGTHVTQRLPEHRF